MSISARQIGIYQYSDTAAFYLSFDWGKNVQAEHRPMPATVSTPASDPAKLRVGERCFEAAQHLACDNLIVDVFFAPNGKEAVFGRCGSSEQGPIYARLGDFVIDGSLDLTAAAGVNDRPDRDVHRAVRDEDAHPLRRVGRRGVPL